MVKKAAQVVAIFLVIIVAVSCTPQQSGEQNTSLMGDPELSWSSPIATQVDRLLEMELETVTPSGNSVYSLYMQEGFSAERITVPSYGEALAILNPNLTKQDLVRKGRDMLAPVLSAK